MCGRRTCTAPLPFWLAVILSCAGGGWRRLTPGVNAFGRPPGTVGMIRAVGEGEGVTWDSEQRADQAIRVQGGAADLLGMPPDEVVLARRIQC